MALTIEQIAAVSYPAVVAELRKASNQWMQNSALNALEKAGFVQRVNFGENIEVPLDYRSNPDTAVLASDQDSAALLKTEVVTSAVFDIAQMNVPVTWTKGDEAKNPTETQKISLVKQLLQNATDSHDDLIEQRIFTSSSVGGNVEVLGLNDLVPTDGQGTVGGISAVTETFWRNQADTFADGSDIEAAMTNIFNDCAKGTGGLAPTLLISGADLHALYESQLQALQRFNDSDKADGGFKSLMFKGAQYIFSHKGSTKIYFLNPKNYQLAVSKQYFRDKGDTAQVPGQNAFYFLVYSALQFIVSNKSRLGVLSQA